MTARNRAAADTHQPTGTAIVFEPTSAEFAADPYPTYAQLRSEPAFQYFAGMDSMLVARFDDINRIALGPEFVRSMEGLFSTQAIEEQRRRNNLHDMPNHLRFVQFSLLDSDGDLHTRLRKPVFRLFTPAAIHKMRQTIQVFVDNLLDSLERSEIDFVADIATPLPGYVIGHLIGVPKQDRPQLRLWSENIVQYWDCDRSAENKKLAEDATTEFYLYLKALLGKRREQPQEDLLTALLDAQVSGELNEDELISTCMQILRAGHGSTLDVLSTGMYNLLRFPDQMARLRENPGLINTAVQEMFRFDSPLPFFHRYATREVTFGETTYPAGTKFGLLYGSANRDPKHFDEPDSFDIGRSPNRHLAFGGGAHFCLGNHLARLDMDIVFTTLLRRYRSIEQIENAAEFRPGISTRGLKRLRLSLGYD